MNLRRRGLAAGRCLFVILVLALLSFLFSACEINSVECDQKCIDFWMDGPIVNDSCGLAGDSTCLVSRRIPHPDSAAKLKPVVIAVHGYTASTAEWEEFRAYAEDSLHTANVSKVLLGGHGVDIDGFQSSSWQEWGKPILEEYDSLSAKGYQNISFA